MKKEYIFAFTAILCWSSIAVITKLLLGSLDSMQITFISSAIALLFLVIANIIKGNMKLIKKYKPIAYLKMAGIGSLGIFVNHVFLYMGIDRMEASQAFIINYLWPIMSVLFGCIILKEKMTARKGIAIAVSFVGVIIVTANGDLLNIGRDTLIGALCCVTNAVAYGLYAVLNKKKNYDQLFAMMIYYLVATIICFIYVLFARCSLAVNAVQLAGLVWMGLFTNAIAFVAWALALKIGDTAKVSNLAYITPVLSLVWTTLFLPEKFNVNSLIGLGVIMLGIFIQLKENKKYRR